MELLQLLESCGVRVVDVSHDTSLRSANGSRFRVDAVISIQIDGREALLLVESRKRAPYRGELAALRLPAALLSGDGIPVLVAPFISASTGRALVEAGWSWADLDGNCDIRTEGLRLVQRISTKPRTATRPSLPGGRGGLTITRWLISECTEPVGATELARIAGVSQPRASQCLASLEQLELVQRVHRSGWRPDRAALWQAFLASYTGPRGAEQLYYSLDSPLETARTVLESFPVEGRVALSADLGPDCLAPSRSPTHLVVYLSGASGSLGTIWEKAEGPADANVIVRFPEDSTVFGFGLDVNVAGTTLPLAHPTQMAWDLLDLGGDDRRESADDLEEWVVKYRNHI